MKKIYVLFLLFLFLTSTAFAYTAQSPLLFKPCTIDPEREKEITKRLNTIQIPFIKNESQIKNVGVKYYAHTFAGTVFITDSEIIYGLKGWVIKEGFLKTQETKAEGIKRAETKVSYFKGRNQNNWKNALPTYTEISLGEIYENIKFTLKAYGKNVEKVLTVEKGGKVEDIAIKVEGAEGLRVNKKGELEIETGIGKVLMTRPIAYQEVAGKRIEVAVAYTILHSAPCTPHYEYGFTVKDYNKNYSLVIDPLLASTFIGAGGYESANALAIDSAGNVFITGFTSSSKFPTTLGAYDTSLNSEDYSDVFVSKLDSNLATLKSSTFLGGKYGEAALALAIDSAGDVFITGQTFSPDFPTTVGAYDTVFNSSEYYDVFVSKLDNNLTTLKASTFLGGKYSEFALALALDSAGDVFIAGQTRSENFPTTVGAYDTVFNSSENYDGFITKLDNNLSTLKASTFLGGKYSEIITALAFDSAGDLFVTGSTLSSNFPTTTGAYDTVFNSSEYYDAFISKLDNNLSTLKASTFLGGKYSEIITALAFDSAGDLFIAGQTRSENFPTTEGAYDTVFNSSENYDAFVSKLDNNLSILKASTFIGGENGEGTFTIAVNSTGDVFIAGHTWSENFPTTFGAYDTIFNSSDYYDAFVSKLDNNLTALKASTFIGGNDNEIVLDLAIDAAGNVLIAGSTWSENFPTTAGAYDPLFNGDEDTFVAKFTPGLSATFD